MLDFSRGLLAGISMPNVVCLREPSLVALHAISNGLITAAFFVIPLVILFLVRRRRDLPFQRAYLPVGALILVSGIMHLLAVVAFASMGTALCW